MTDEIYDLLEALAPEAEAIKNNQALAPEGQALLTRLQSRLNDLYAADIADLLEALPADERSLLWHLTNPAEDGEILLEVSEGLRESLISEMDREELNEVVENLEVEELVELYENLPAAVAHEALGNLDSHDRARVDRALGYEEGTVGAIMDFSQENLISVREDVPCEVVFRYLRMHGKRNGDELPRKFDKVFVVDEQQRLCGTLSLRYLLASDPGELVSARMLPLDEVIYFTPEMRAEKAGQAFEKYDLVSAPVVDEQLHIIGRLTVDDMMDVMRQETEEDMMNILGIEDEDLFAPIKASLKNRGMWICINLATALLASRIIAGFSEIINQLVALAALLPIVAGIAGNSGNQTITMIVRALAMGQLSTAQAGRLLKKEIGVALVNGVIWGSVMGLISWALYGSVGIGLVMVAAMTLNLLLAATVGVLIPVTMEKFGKDPALGSSVLITAVTDSGGFLIFLGLATLFLL